MPPGAQEPKQKASAVQRGQYYALRMRIYLKWEPQLQDSPVLAGPVVQARPPARPKEQVSSLQQIWPQLLMLAPQESLRPQAKARQKRKMRAPMQRHQGRQPGMR